jgi:hypothetical protein
MSEQAAIRQAPNRVLGAALGTCLAEGLITLSALQLDPPISVLVVSHAGVSLLLAGLTRRQTDKASLFLLLAIATAATGLLGAVGMTIALIADSHRRSPRSPSAQAAGETAVTAVSKRLHSNILSGRELSDRSSGLAAIRDVLAFGSFQEKQTALAIMTRRFTPQLAPALQLALRDPDAAVRVQAATAAARIEDLFLAGLTRYTASLAAQPDDPDGRLKLALHLLGHAAAGLCSPERASADLDQALVHLRRAVASAPLRRDIRLAIAKVLVLRREPEEAARHLEALLEPLSAEELLVYGEALYRASRWDELRRLFGNSTMRPELPSAIREMAALWAHPAESV